MAAVVASHHAGLWQQNRDPHIQIPNMHLANMMAPYDNPRTMANTPSSRSYQPTTTHVDMSMPLYPTNSLTTSVPYQSGAFAFDSSSVNPYNMQQTSFYSPNIAHAISYSAAPVVQSLSTVRDGPNAYVVDRNTMVKSETTSPTQSSQMFSDTSYSTAYKRSSSEPIEGSSINFATDVDTLMRAIQAKQSDSPQEQEPEVLSTQFHRQTRC